VRNCEFTADDAGRYSRVRHAVRLFERDFPAPPRAEPLWGWSVTMETMPEYHDLWKAIDGYKDAPTWDARTCAMIVVRERVVLLFKALFASPGSLAARGEGESDANG